MIPSAANPAGLLSFRALIRSLAALFFSAVLVAPASAAAAPPCTSFDLGKALAVYDIARWASHTSAPASDASTLTRVQTLVIDPGHGGENEGAVGVLGVHEKYLTIELALDLRDRLQRAHPNLRVVLTRYWDSDVALPDRIAMANQRGADLFISLHYNAAVHARAVGFETYFLATHEAVPGQGDVKGQPIAATGGAVTGLEKDLETKPSGPTAERAFELVLEDLHRSVQHRRSGRLAEIVQKQLRSRLKSVNRGVKQANFAVLRGAEMPAIVVESGFLTHPKEGKKVHGLEHRKQVIEALMEAVVEFDRTLEAEQTPLPSS